MHCAATRRVVYCRLFSFLPLRGKVQRLWGLRLCDLGGLCCLCVSKGHVLSARELVDL